MNGLKDFALLSVLLEPGERGNVFTELGQEETDEALASMVAFAYLGVEGDRYRFETCLEHGILQGATVGQFSESSGRATDADVSISIEYDPNIEALYQRFEDGGQLTDAEIGALVRAGRIGGDDLEELAESSGGFPVFLSGRGLSRRSNVNVGCCEGLIFTRICGWRFDKQFQPGPRLCLSHIAARVRQGPEMVGHREVRH